MLSHATEELAYVLSGVGELRLDEDVVTYAAGSALFIPGGRLALGREHRQ